MNIRIVLLFIFCLTSFSALAKPSIAWFSTLQQDLSDKSGFWKSLHDLMVATAQDLDVDFQIYYAQENFVQMHGQVKAVLSNEKKRPDGIIFHNYKKVAPLILAQAEQYGVKSFIFNSGLTGEHEHYAPRQHYKHWIGQMLPDDKFAGSELARCLVAAAKETGIENSFQLLAMEGNLSSRAYQSRKDGLEGFMKSHSKLEFTQYFPADWSRSKANKMFSLMIKRYPKVQILWSANDNMALGLIDAAQNSDYKLGKDIFVGGVDWLAESIEAIKKGDMACSVGGHFVEGMWALILMYDYLNGFDFVAQRQDLNSPATVHTKMAAISSTNVKDFGDLAQKLSFTNLLKMDFSQYSHTHNRKVEPYDFSITRLLEKL